MARLIEEIILKLGLDLTGVEAGTKRVNDNLEDLEDGVDGYSDSAKASEAASDKMGGAILGVAAAAAAATAALGIMIAKNIEAQTETLHMAEALGIGAQRLQDLQNLARVFNAEADDMVQGIKNINESISEAFVDQSGEKFDLFKELNVDLAEFESLAPDQQFIAFAKALDGASTQGRRQAIQLAIMGEEGFKLSTTMRALGRDSEAALNKVANKGGDIDTEQISRFSEQWNLLKISIEGVTDGIVDSFIPVLQGPLDSAVKHFGETARIMAGIDFEGIAARAKEEAEAFNRELAQIRGPHLLINSQEAIEGEKAERQRLTKELARQQEERRRGAGQRAFNRRQQVAEEQLKNRKIEEERKKQEARDKRAAQRVLDRQEREKNSAIRTIESIGRSKKKERLAELRDRQITGGLSAVEAGSSEAARLAAERSGININERAEIARLEREIAAEEKKIEEDQLKTARESLKALNKIADSGVTTIKTKRIK